LPGYIGRRTTDENAPKENVMPSIDGKPFRIVREHPDPTKPRRGLVLAFKSKKLRQREAARRSAGK
jgi:hypothetical protein